MRTRVVLALLATACGGRGAGAGPVMPLLDIPADDVASQVVVAALLADAAFHRADTLYEDDAVLVADGMVRRTPPHYAAIGPGGSVAITSSRIELRAGIAVVQVAYRWVSLGAAQVREAIGTFVIGPDAQGRWKIRHAHSSESRPPGLDPSTPLSFDGPAWLTGFP